MFEGKNLVTDNESRKVDAKLDFTKMGWESQEWGVPGWMDNLKKVQFLR